MSEDLLTRLDRIGVHQSVAARYCKEAAAEIRRLRVVLAKIAGDPAAKALGHPGMQRLASIAAETAPPPEVCDCEVTGWERSSDILSGGTCRYCGKPIAVKG